MINKQAQEAEDNKQDQVITNELMFVVYDRQTGRVTFMEGYEEEYKRVCDDIERGVWEHIGATQETANDDQKNLVRAWTCCFIRKKILEANGLQPNDQEQEDFDKMGEMMEVLQKTSQTTVNTQQNQEVQKQEDREQKPRADDVIQNRPPYAFNQKVQPEELRQEVQRGELKLKPNLDKKIEQGSKDRRCGPIIVSKSAGNSR